MSQMAIESDCACAGVVKFHVQSVDEHEQDGAWGFPPQLENIRVSPLL